jgi:hypothetical protein
MKKLNHDQLEAAFKKAVRGMARLQARQEMMECIVRALIVATPPAHPLFWKALDTAKSDWENRSNEARAVNLPEIDADAMALWNVLQQACQPSAGEPNAAD